MAEKAENIKRIMSPFLRMVGGRIRWIAEVLHIRKEDDSDFAGLESKDIKAEVLSITDPTRTEAISLKADATTDSYELVLPKTEPNPGQFLRSINNKDLEWSNDTETGSKPTFEEYPMAYGQLTYPILYAPDLAKPIQVMVNGIEVEFTSLANTITITSYSPGEIANSDILRVYYYK